MANKLNLDRKLQKFLQRKESIMRSIGNNSVNFFKVTVFNYQGWPGAGGVKRWAPRKADKTPGRKLLVKSGTGRQSIHIVKLTANQVQIAADAPYMRFHNEGTKSIPQRKFMGDSPELAKQNKAIILRNLKDIL